MKTILMSLVLVAICVFAFSNMSFVSPQETPPVLVKLEFNPETLNIRSRGNTVTIYVNFTDTGFKPSNVTGDVFLYINDTDGGQLPVGGIKATIQQVNDTSGILTLKCSRQTVVGIINQFGGAARPPSGTTYYAVINGTLISGEKFQGHDEFRAIGPGKKSSYKLTVQLSANPSTVEVGGTFSLKVTVKNTGTKVLNNIEATVTLPNGLSPSGSITYTIPSLGPQSSQDIFLTVTAVKQGTAKISVVAQADGVSASSSIQVRVRK